MALMSSAINIISHQGLGINSTWTERDEILQGMNCFFIVFKCSSVHGVQGECGRARLLLPPGENPD